MSAQRQFLRRTFAEAVGHGGQFAIEHASSLADIADFRDRFWRLGDITEISNIHVKDIEELDHLLLSLAFIRATGTKLAIPILATYWRRSKENRGVSFPRAAKSIAAFIALRRTMTGGTARIEERFRSVMGKQNVLKRDADPSNEALDRLLLELLRSEPDPVVSKSQWLNRSKSMSVPRNSSSSAVAKFMLLAAAHNSDPLRNGLWNRGSRLPSDEKSYLTHGTWSSTRYKTVEHIAPQSRNVEGWDSMIYADPSTVGMLGNQVLLPQRENASVGKASWRKKKAYYSALAAVSPERRAELIREAQDLGVDFPPQTIKLVSGQARLRMLDPIVNVNQWTEDLIRSRTENVLDLSWDSLAPWIDGLN